MAQSSSAVAQLRQPAWLLQFGRQLRLARGRAGLTQQQLAAPDLTKSFISLLESGRSYPSVETTVALARRLGASVASLLFDTEDLRFETASSLMHLASAIDPAAHGKDALRFVETAKVLLPDMPTEFRARAALVRGHVAMSAGQMDAAVRAAHDAARMARRHRLGAELGRAMVLEGIVEERRGAFQTAIPILQNAIGTMRKARSLRSAEGVWALLSLGAAWIRTGEMRQARDAYRRALDLATRLQFSRLRGRALTGLGVVEWGRKRLDRAVDFLSRAHDVFAQLEEPFEVGRVLTNLGRIRLEQGLHGEALAVLQKALRIRESQHRDRRGKSATLDEIARVLLAMGRLREAARAARRAVREGSAAHDWAREAVARATLGQILRASGREREAATMLRGTAARLARLGMTEDGTRGRGGPLKLLDEPLPALPGTGPRVATAKSSHRRKP